MRKHFITLWLALLAPLLAQAAAAAGAVGSARLLADEHIEIDGSLDHPAWKRAPVFKGFQEAEPNRGAEPKFETLVQVLVDERAIYVGVTALDPHPELIRSDLVRHDQVRGQPPLS